MRSEDLAPMIVGVFFFLVSGFIVKVALEYRSKMRVMKARADTHTHLVDKFGSAPEFVQFLQTEGGRSLLENITSEQSPAAQGILGSIQKGSLLTVLGLGLLLLGSFAQVGREGSATLHISGAIGLSLGIGYLISAGISYRLSKAWGLMTGAEAGKR